MNGARSFLRRPFGEQLLALRIALAALVVGAIALVVVVASVGEAGNGSAPAPSPVVTKGSDDDADDDRSPIDRPALARAETSARSFARSYLAVLYGRGGSTTVGRATDALRRRVGRELIRVPPTRAELRPRIVTLRLFPRDSTTVTAEALVDDGDAPRYPLRFLVSTRRDRWLVTTLLND